MNVVFLPPADQELHDAVDYYNEQLPGLGHQFYAFFFYAVKYINKYPEMWRKIGPNTRRCNIRRFPYLILYVVDGENIVITCIAHQHREPVHYMERIT